MFDVAADERQGPLASLKVSNALKTVTLLTFERC
jgi:hypothetical protein